MDLEASFKTLATVFVPVATYIAGLLTEPAKKWLLNRSERKRLRNALYSELAGNLNQSLIFVSNLQDPKNYPFTGMDVWLRTETHQDALTKQMFLFHEIREGKTISEIYLLFNIMKGQDPTQQRSSFSSLVEWIKLLVRSGKLSRSMLNRHHSLGVPSVFDFRHPLVQWSEKAYRRLIFRNIPKPIAGTAYAPGFSYAKSDSFLKTLKALYRGIPGEPQPLGDAVARPGQEQPPTTGGEGPDR